MALATSPTSTAPPSMSPTPGISPESLSVNPHQGNRAFGDNAPSMGAPQAPDTPPAPPVLFADIEPVHFVRLYPDALMKGGNAARDAAMAVGHATFEAAKTLVASQQDSGDNAPPSAGASGATGATGATGAAGARPAQPHRPS